MTRYQFFSRVSAICEYGILGFYSEFSYRAAYHRYAFLLGFSLSFNSLFCLFIVVCYLHYFICHVCLTSPHGCTERRTTAGGLGLTSTVLFMWPSFIFSSFKVTISLHICFVGHIKEIYSQKIMAFHCRQDIQEKKWSKEATPLVVNKEKTTIEDVGMKVEQAVQMFDRRFTDTLLTHFCYYRSRLSTDGRLMIGQYSDQHLTNTRPTLRRNIDRYVDRHSTDIRPMLDRYSL